MTDLKETYDQASELFPPKLAKDKREASPEISDFIRKNFLPESQDKTMQEIDKLFPTSKKDAKERLREYLSDTICEFVDTNCLTAEEFYEVLMECAYQNYDYYQRNAERNWALLELLQYKQYINNKEYSQK